MAISNQFQPYQLCLFLLTIILQKIEQRLNAFEQQVQMQETELLEHNNNIQEIQDRVSGVEKV